jgi:hypothetical protein
MSHSMQLRLINYPDWQVQYMDALFEDDPSKLKERISAAESVLTSRLHAISHDPNASTERSKIENALANLRTLVRVSGIQTA